LPPATLTREVSSVEADSNDSVSEQLQRGSEVDSIWCKNILADHPPWAQSSGHGKEISGEIGVLGLATPLGHGT
jgi:hypothetical protein